MRRQSVLIHFRSRDAPDHSGWRTRCLTGSVSLVGILLACYEPVPGTDALFPAALQQLQFLVPRARVDGREVLQPFGGDRRRDRRYDGGRHRRQPPAQGMISIASRRTMKSPYSKSSLASYRAASSEELDLAKSGGISATTERDRVCRLPAGERRIRTLGPPSGWDFRGCPVSSFRALPPCEKGRRLCESELVSHSFEFVAGPNRRRSDPSAKFARQLNIFRAV